MFHPWTGGMSTYPGDDPYPSSGFVPTNRFGGSNVQTFFPDRSGPRSPKYPKVQHHLLPSAIQALHWNHPLKLIHCHCRHSMSRAILQVQRTVQRPNRVPMWSACSMPWMEYESYCCTGVQLSFTHSWICYKMGLNLQNYTTSIPRKKKLCHINGRTDPIKRRSALKSPKFHTPSACIKLTPRTMCNISSLLHLPIGRNFLPRYWWKMVHMKCRWLERRSLFPLRCFGLVFPWGICECVHYFDFWHPTSITQTGCVSDFLVRNQDLVGAPSRKSEDYGVRLLENQKPTPKNI